MNQDIYPASSNLKMADRGLNCEWECNMTVLGGPMIQIDICVIWLSLALCVCFREVPLNK